MILPDFRTGGSLFTQSMCSDCITTWPSPSPQHHWPKTLSETHSSHKHNALYTFWGVTTYIINFCVRSSNDLNMPDLISNSLDETSHQFFYNTMASNCGSVHSLVQLTQHLHYVYQRHYFPILHQPLYIAFSSHNQSIRSKICPRNCETYKVHSVSCNI